jgi:hypothetical protein
MVGLGHIATLNNEATAQHLSCSHVCVVHNGAQLSI